MKSLKEILYILEHFYLHSKITAKITMLYQTTVITSSSD